jgi:hypothetical protein
MISHSGDHVFNHITISLQPHNLSPIPPVEWSSGRMSRGPGYEFTSFLCCFRSVLHAQGDTSLVEEAASSAGHGQQAGMRGWGCKCAMAAQRPKTVTMNK